MPGGRVECTSDTLQAFLSLGWEGSGSGGGESVGESASAAAVDADEHAAMRRLLFALGAMHARLVSHLGRTWQRMCAEPTTTLMDFPTALRETFAHMQRAFRLSGSAGPWRLETLVGHLESELAAQPILESFGPLSETVGAYSTWAFAACYTAAADIYQTLVGVCFSAPPDGALAAHDKRQ